MWNSANSTITGFAISSVDMGSLHDVYEGLDEEEECHKTEYILQFLWRDVSSDFDVIGPYFNLSNSIEAQHLHSFVTRTMLVFVKYGFRVLGLLCDGASSNLALLKQFCNSKKGDKCISPFFKLPFDGHKVYLIICPSHQVIKIAIKFIIIISFS